MMHREERETTGYCITIESSIMRATRGKQSALVKKKAKTTLLLFGLCLIDFKKLRLDFVPVDKVGKFCLIHKIMKLKEKAKAA